MNSKELFEKALKLIPGGVNSPVRAFRGVGGIPFFTKKADKSFLYTQDNATLIDFVSTWGPALFGHNHPKIRQAILDAVQNGTSFGTPSAAEVEIAEIICSKIDSAEMVRMVNSGTEATMSAVRLARGYTRRDKIVKFEGCYHGHTDSLLVKAGSGALTFGSPDSAGIPQDLAKLTIVLDYNDIEQVKETFESFGDEIAAVILEPFPANCGLILPKPNFLESLRQICTKYGALLIFDEVITGFRLGEGGAQRKTGVLPDITTLGKIIGGGLPVGAFCGRREIMQKLSPLGDVYQAGTLSGNPVCMAAGIASLKLIDEICPYKTLSENTAKFAQCFKDALSKKGIAAQVHFVDSLMSVFFTEREVYNFKDAVKSDSALYARLFHKCLQKGLYFAPSAFECMFMSLSCSDSTLDKACEIVSQAIGEL